MRRILRELAQYAYSGWVLWPQLNRCITLWHMLVWGERVGGRDRATRGWRGEMGEKTALATGVGWGWSKRVEV